MYKHTQFGTVIVASVGGFFVFLLVSSFLSPELRLMQIVAVIMFLVLLLFYNLTITVSDGVCKASFGIGVITKTIKLSEVAAVNQVRNSWIYGFGIRYLGRRTWLYNVSGLDAVEFDFGDGKKVCFGTDDPNGLLSAVEQYIAKS